MATYKQGILGPFSGKVGTVVGSSWRGIAYIRSLATKVANPRTAAQLEVRNKLSATSKRLRLFISSIRRGFVNSGAASGWSAAVKFNRPSVSFDEKTGSYVFPIEDVKLSDGAKPFDVAVSNAAGVISAAWEAPAAADELYGGKLYMAVYNAKNDKAANFSASLSAADAQFNAADVLGAQGGDELHVLSFAATGSLSTQTTHQKLA